MKRKLKSAIVATIVGATFLLSSQAFAAEVMFTNSTSTNSSFDRGKAADYAETWATTANPDFANYGSNSDGGDCTNFVSQALYKGGGLAFNGSKGYNRNTVDWYYYGPHVPPSTNPRTSSWTGAHQFREHFAVINNQGGKKLIKQQNTHQKNYRIILPLYMLNCIEEILSNMLILQDTLSILKSSMATVPETILKWRNIPSPTQPGTRISL